MAEVQQNNSGEGGKGKQKKQTLRVDFTPMVDMNMLLITFFMLATTLLKPQTMDLNMPAKDKVEKDASNKVRESDAITLLLGANDKLYYYEGMIEEDGSTYENPDFLKESSYGAEGVRQLLLKRNASVYEEIQDLKAQLDRLDITEEQFKERWKDVQNEAIKSHKAPNVLIKPTEFSSYKNFVDAVDEMLIANIGAYAVVDLAEGDRYLLYKKTDDGNYLSEEQRAQAGGN